MTLLDNLKAEVKKNKAKENKVSFHKIPYDTELPSIITNVCELEGNKISVEFAVIVSSNVVIKRRRVYGGNYGMELLSNMMDIAGVDEVNELIGMSCYVELRQNGEFTNVDISQFIDNDEFESLITDIEKKKQILLE